MTPRQIPTIRASISSRIAALVFAGVLVVLIITAAVLLISF